MVTSRETSEKKFILKVIIELFYETYLNSMFIQ